MAGPAFTLSLPSSLTAPDKKTNLQRPKISRSFFYNLLIFFEIQNFHKKSLYLLNLLDAYIDFFSEKGTRSGIFFGGTATAAITDAIAGNRFDFISEVGVAGELVPLHRVADQLLLPFRSRRI